VAVDLSRRLVMGCRGRCAGCGQTGLLKAVNAHIVTCSQWAVLYKQDREAVLEPADELVRWEQQDKDGERAARVQERITQTDERRAVMMDRFTARDPLEDG
jgi:hypothetical protein